MTDVTDKTPTTPTDTADTADERRQRERGTDEARELEQKWVKGQGNTSDRNFTTQGDRQNPRDFAEDLGDIGEDTLK